MKTNTKAAQSLLERVKPLKVGDVIKFNNFLTGFGSDLDAHCVEIEDGRFWEFSLFWNSVFLQKVVIEKLPNELVIDTLGD
jgi:hypothetical protein